MENARLLDERLRKIIREIGLRTGGEIKQDLLSDFGREVRSTVEEQARRETVRLLHLLKKAVDNM